MSPLIAAFVAELGIITWRDLHKQKILPIPSDYAAAALIFGAFGLVGEASPKVAAWLGWGIVLATFLELWDPTNPTNISGTPGIAPTGNNNPGQAAAETLTNASTAQAVTHGQTGTGAGATRAAQFAQQGR
jgi:hypothetical protein